MKMYRKWLSVLLAFAMLFALFAGCAPKSPGGGPEEPDEPVTEWTDFEDAQVSNDATSTMFPKFTKLTKLYSVEYDYGSGKVYDAGADSYGEFMTMTAMQGLIARNGTSTEGIYVNLKRCGGYADNAYDRWLNEMVQYDGVTVEVVEEDTTKTGDAATPYYQMMDKFKDQVAKTSSGKPGYIVFDQQFEDGKDPEGNLRKVGSQSVNAACTAAGVTGYLPINVTDKEMFDALGYEEVLDVSDWTEEQAFDEFKDEISTEYLSLTPNAYAENRDLGIALGMFFLDECYSDNDFCQDKLSQKFPAGNGAIMMGWSSANEVQQIRQDAMYGFGFLCTVYSLNMTVFSSMGHSTFEQRNSEEDIKADPDKHYVAFLFTDGDNISWHANDFSFNDGYYGWTVDKEVRKESPFKMGWTTSMTMADLTPAIMRYEYMKSSPYDYFYAGTSGAEIMYPSLYGEDNKASLTKLAEQTNAFMARTGIEYTEILDDNVFDEDVLQAYASQPNIKGGFVLANYDYYVSGGDAQWVDGKPFLGVAESFWSDTPGRVAYRLNSLPADIDSVNGYTLVKVHCWTTPMADVAKMVEKLDDHIEIVSPGELIKMVDKNVPHEDNDVAERTVYADEDYPEGIDEYLDPVSMWAELPLNTRTNFEFNNTGDYEGWECYIGPKVYDNIQFSSEVWQYEMFSARTSADNDPNGDSLRIDSGDYGLTDNTPGAAIYSKLKVPDSDKAIFRFFSRGDGFGFDCDIRTRVIRLDESGTPVIEELKTGLEYPESDSQNSWTVNGDIMWKETVYDVSHLRGQEVIFVIEHNATAGEGDGEILYLDNISIGEDKLDVEKIREAEGNSMSDSTYPEARFDFASGAQEWVNYTAGGTASYDSAMQALKVTTTATKRADALEADAVWYTRLALPEEKTYTHYKYGVTVQAAPGTTALVRIGGIMRLGNGTEYKAVRSTQYQVIGDQPTYLDFELDTYSVRGLARTYFYPFVEVSSNGEATDVYITQANYSTYLRDVENGIFMDTDRFHAAPERTLSELSDIGNWSLQTGRGMGDEAYVTDGKILLSGYDYMRYDETALVSKKVGGWSKVKDEFNARMFANVDLASASTLTFTYERTTETALGGSTTIPKFRVLFLDENGDVTVVSSWKRVSSNGEQTAEIDLASVAGKAGTLILDMDVDGNAQTAGIYVWNISIS